MAMPRFFVPPEQVRDNRFTLTGSEARHAILVLRKKIGDEIDLFDGKDASFRGRIEHIAHEDVRGSVIQTLSSRRLPVAITLFQALIRGPRWDWLLQKACEIGVDRVVPLETARSVVRMETGDSAKLERWRRIATEASKQCGRQTLMQIDSPRRFSDALAKGSDLALIPWEKEIERRVADACRAFSGQSIALYVGPEGGWEGAEVTAALSAGIIPVRLGPTLLRSETAGLVAATLALAELGVY